MWIWTTVVAALANGGPDDWTRPTPIGSARPESSVHTRLVREDLVVTMTEDYDAVHAVATYTLRNDGEAETLRYAVPMLDELYPEPPGSRSHRDPRMTLTLDGVDVPCTVGPLPSDRELPFEIVRNNGERMALDPFHVSTACWSELTVPPGEHTLVLDAVEEPLHFSFSTSKDKFPGSSARQWVWLLAPASAWAGRVEEVRIDIDTGALGALVRPRGAGWVATDGHLTQVLRDVDLATVEPLTLDLDVQALDRQRVMLALNHKPWSWKPARAEASSTLEGSPRYAPSHLFDGDPRTAWCEGADGKGVGEWVELTYGKENDIPIYVGHGAWLLVLPGYAKSPTTWTSNGRVERLTLSPCGGGPEQSVTVPVGSDPSTAVQSIPLEMDAALTPILTPWRNKESDACVRVRIDAVAAGSTYEDTCVSELGLIVE